MPGPVITTAPIGPPRLALQAKGYIAPTGDRAVVLVEIIPEHVNAQTPETLAGGIVAVLQKISPAVRPQVEAAPAGVIL